LASSDVSCVKPNADVRTISSKLASFMGAPALSGVFQQR
jgi:hypothetical protein